MKVKEAVRLEQLAEGVAVGLIWDSDPISPDEPEDEGYAFLGEVRGGRHCFGDRRWTVSEAREYLTWDEAVEAGLVDPEEGLHDPEEWESMRREDYVVFPVRLYDSYEPELRFCDHRAAEGYVFVKVPWVDVVSRLAFPDFPAREIAEEVVHCWNLYLNGKVYGFIVFDTGDVNVEELEEWEELDFAHLDSCWGFYGEAEAWGEGVSSAMSILAERKAREAM